ncbi:MAG: type II/IV secretion system ATPase subunit [Thermoplasmata archaeon]
MADTTKGKTEKKGNNPLTRLTNILKSPLGFNKTPRRVKLAKSELENKEKVETGEGGWISPYTQIPEITDENIAVEEIYGIREPFSFVRILNDNNRKETIYEGIEPTLTEKEEEWLHLIKDTLDRTLSYDWESMETKDKEEFIEESVESYIRSRGLNIEEKSKKRLIYFILRDYVRYGPIDVIMSDDYVEDISCDGIDIPLFIYHAKYESIRTTVKFEDEKILNSFIIQLGQRCGKQVSVSDPILDGTTKEGHRVQATYAKEVSTRGSSITIRRYKEEPFTPVDLVTYNTASPEMVAYMWLMVENGKSMIVAGGTATGKTATLNSATLFIPPGPKIVSLEDTREINLPQENWIPSTTRTGSGESKGGRTQGEVTMYDLVRNALRQRPDYIIVGEVRGKEAHTMFQAMATGHTTYSTMHADSVESMVHRLENEPINCPRVLLTALEFVIIQNFARVEGEEVRRIQEITELVGFEPESDELITNTVFEWERKSDGFVYKGHSFNFDNIMEMKNMTQEEMNQEFEDRIEIIEYLVEQKGIDYREISRIVTSYYKEPEETLAKIRGEEMKDEGEDDEEDESGGEE